MELEKQCVSLELAKKLKELNIPQESLWYWNDEGKHLKSGEAFIMSGDNEMAYTDHSKIYSAFTASELGEMLLEDRVRTAKWKGLVSCYCSTPRYCFVDNTMADAMAKMLIYLLENKLIPTPQGEE